MDSKTLKKTLKQAKEAVKNKDVDLALRLCKAVLKEDRKNYFALVLLGAAFQESDQKDKAPNAFRKAIEISPEELLAWQGLASFYEKADSIENAEELVPVYQRLLELERDPEKWSDILLKVQAVITKLKNDECLSQIVEFHKSTDESNKLSALCKLVVHYLSQLSELPQKNLELYEELLNLSTSELENDYYKIYFKMLYKQKKSKEMLEFAGRLLEKNCQDPCVSEWICKVCLEEFVENRASVLEWCKKLPQHYDILVEREQGNLLGIMAQGVYFMSQNVYEHATTCFEYCVSKDDGLFHALCLLAETHLRKMCLEQAKELAEKALKQQPHHVLTKAVMVKALSLSDEPADWEKAVNLASEVQSEESGLALEGLCQALLKLQQWPQLSSALPRLSVQSPALATLLHLESQAGQGEGDLLQSLSQDTPACPEAWYRLGQLQLDACAYQQAYNAFQKCANAAPYWYTVHLKLAYVFSLTKPTLEMASKSYQRALELRPNYMPAMKALSEVLHDLGQTESYVALLESACQQEDGQWAWASLGLQQLKLGNITAAIHCLLTVLRRDPSHSHLWEALADAYLARRANGSALRSYQKVLELKPEAFYPALQIATIKRMTDMPHESLLEFRQLIKRQPDSILALKGLCQTCLHLTNMFLARRLLGLARDMLQEGFTTIVRAIELKPDLTCLWKLGADCLSKAGSLPRAWHYLEVPKPFSTTDGPETLKGAQLLIVGSRLLCRCLKMLKEKNQASVWHDLALNYIQQIRLNRRSTDNSAENRDLAQKALAMAKQSVKLRPKNWHYWNLLGIIAAMPEVHRRLLAQHSFIKATMMNRRQAVPWANLGCLYLSVGELKLANAAFSNSQRINSEYYAGWVGQALIAEKVENEDTMDLFRHATQLGYHTESAMGYGHWVCHTLMMNPDKDDPNYIYSIEKMHAVPVAIDALTWVTEEDEENVCALNMLGCLMERCGQYDSSMAVFSKAVDVCPPEHKDLVLANLGRVLLCSEKVDDAIEVYKAIRKGDLHSQCGLALSLFKGKKYEEAYEAYQMALDWWATTDEVKGHLSVALAIVAFMMNGPDHSQTLLSNVDLSKGWSMNGLFAICSLGLLNNNLELSRLALCELLKSNDEDYISKVSLFQAYIKFVQGDVQGSVWSMSKAVLRYPTQATLWLHLAALILHKHSADQKCQNKVYAAAHCARTALSLGQTQMDTSKVLSVVSVSQLISGDIQQALSASQHAVHLYPTVGESWSVLVASCYAAQKEIPIRKMISHARQNLDLERPLVKWMSTFERKLALSSSQ